MGQEVPAGPHPGHSHPPAPPSAPSPGQSTERSQSFLFALLPVVWTEGSLLQVLCLPPSVRVVGEEGALESEHSWLLSPAHPSICLSISIKMVTSQFRMRPSRCSPFTSELFKEKSQVSDITDGRVGCRTGCPGLSCSSAAPMCDLGQVPELLGTKRALKSSGTVSRHELIQEKHERRGWRAS